jgi:hypothetical protein
MRAGRRIALQVEEVEPRSLMSGVAMTASLAGHVQGPAAHRRGTPDEGLIYRLRGVGRLDALGPVRVAGEVNTSFLTGRFIGLMTLSNRFGKVEIEIKDSYTPRDDFDFVVRSASGRYSQLVGEGGVLDLGIHRLGNRARFEMDVNPAES